VPDVAPGDPRLDTCPVILHETAGHLDQVHVPGQGDHASTGEVALPFRPAEPAGFEIELLMRPCVIEFGWHIGHDGYARMC
jgi:hypothetical protein